MSFLCKIGFHKWYGCKCTKCGLTRDENHSWDGCKCTKCDKTQDENHSWKKNDCNICESCGKIRTDGHIWNGCICSRCNKKRDENHSWDGCKCDRCGKEMHNWKGCICRRCGKKNEMYHAWEFGKCIGCGKEETGQLTIGRLVDVEISQLPENWRNNFAQMFGHETRGTYRSIRSMLSSGLKASVGGRINIVHIKFENSIQLNNVPVIEERILRMPQEFVSIPIESVNIPTRECQISPEPIFAWKPD